jgi:hypothetical protein
MLNDAHISDALNALSYEERFGCYTGAVEIDGVPIDLMLHTDDADDLEPALQRARELLAGFSDYSRRAEEYAVQELLPLKNDIWLEEDEAPVTAAEFKQRMILEALVFYAEGDVTFYYQDGDLFWGHTIELRLDAADNFIHADIPG